METDTIPSRALPSRAGDDRADGRSLPGDTTVEQAEFVFAKVRAQRSATLIQLAALAGAGLCIALAAMLHGPINNQRRDLQLVLQSDLYKELPAKYAWVSAAGGTFRGIAADVLWMRAETLKQEGKYYELHQLAKWICTLQPRFADVWSFQAWNMSYNISVATHTTQERWQWVYNGIRLLRDEGIPNNEKAVKLYHQLAWTYFHKIGERLDDHQLKYKRIWATTMEVLLGTPSAAASDAEQVAYIKPVADAPRTLEELYARQPGTRALAEKLQELGVDVEATTNPKNIFHPLETALFKRYTAWMIEKRSAGLRKTARKFDEQTTGIFAFFDGAKAADLDALLACLRSKVLREQYKMDPQFMYNMQTRLGTEQPLPIDWRTPWAHSLYWAMYGTDKGKEVKSIDSFDLLNTDRVVLFSLGQIARQGDYVFRPNLEAYEESFLDTRPDWRYVEAVHQTALRLGKVYREEGEVVENTAGEAFRDYHINTLHSLLLGLYFAGHTEQAQKYYEYLMVNYPDRYTGKTNKIYHNFHDFVQEQIKDMAQTQYEATMLINSLLYDAYMDLSTGRGEGYSNRGRQAYTVYESYQKDKADDREGRRTLPPWAQMQADALAGFVTSPDLPPVIRVIAWQRETSDEVKKRCYDDIRPVLEEMFGQSDLDLNKAFPVPPGMEEWRKSHPADTPEQVANKAIEAKRKADKEKQKQ